MRIRLLTQYYPPEIGAAPVRLQAMVRELVRLGHDVDVITALPSYPTGRIFDGYRRRLFLTESRDGATVHRVWAHAATGSGIGRMMMFLSFSVMSTLALFRRPRPDLLLVESPPLTAVLPAMVHQRLRRSKMVILLADLWPDTAIELGLLQEDGRTAKALFALERRAYRAAFRISPVTDGQIDALRTKGVTDDRIAFLPNGVDTSLFRPDTSDRAISKVILFAGTLGYAQGLDVVLDASRLVVEAHPDAQFLFVGGGSDKARLQQRVTDEGLQGIEFRDPVPVDEVAPLYRECFAGITTLRRSPTLDGARPSKIFPIMASGRPVVYSGDGEGARLIATHQAGVVAPAEDVEQLAAVIIDLLNDQATADQLGRNGRELVTREFSWPVLLQQWLDRLGESARR